MTTILLVEDEQHIRTAVRNALAPDFTMVAEAASGQQGIALVASAQPAVIVLDLALPDLEGIDVCRELRRRTAAPIVVLSARHTDEEKVALLDAGADDYVTKPFSPSELRARVRAQLRRASMAPAGDDPTPVAIDDIVIDTARRVVRRGAEYIHLTPIEWSLVGAFLARRGRTLTHQQIFRAVWGVAEGDAQAYLRVHIANLRRKIERDPVRPELIVTEPGVGYRFDR